MNTDQTAEAVFEMLARSGAGHAEQASRLLVSIGTQSDDHRMYGVCCALAGAGTQMLYKVFGDQPPEHMWALKELSPGALAADPAKGFAVRFLIANANGDRDTTLALFQAALHADGDQYVDSVCALLTQVASLCRLAQQTA
ncbi:hypothetical protein [Streptomyces sp. CBG31]|uniref:hypothetical protein n=1 Tax=Streptomyces sp. CBG31 TaxID=2762623 RepID=UPI001EFCF171|nr:hypothetical protein [Streptomyces sp. CBG31]